MSPHVEVKCQAVVGGGGIEHTFGTHWEKVPGTDHWAISKTKAAQKAHTLVGNDPENYREVEDWMGKPCRPASGAVFGGLLFQPKEKG